MRKGVKERRDFMPYGDDLPAGVGVRTNAQGYLNTGGTPGMSVLFTGQYHDTELASSQMPSGMDYFGARHHVPAFGRFMQPDPAGNFVADPENRRSWHLYNYVWNNPFAYVDPTGLDVEQIGNCYFNVTHDSETGSITSYTLAFCAQPTQGTNSNPTPPPPDQSSSQLSPIETPTNPCNYAGRALDPSAYAAAGHAARLSPITTSLDAAKGFAIGGYLDAQPLAVGNDYQGAAYGNYVFGVYMQTNGWPLGLTLQIANVVAFKNKQGNSSQYHCCPKQS